MCPMTQATVEKHGLTDREIEKFCDEGCSVECWKFLNEYLQKRYLKKKNRQSEQISMFAL